MPNPTHGLSLAVLSLIYCVSESFLKRASAAGVNLRSDAEIKRYIKLHASNRTKESFNSSDYYQDAVAFLHGTTRDVIAEMALAGYSFRDPAEVKAYLAAKRQSQAPKKLGSGVSAPSVEAISHATHFVSPPPPAPAASPKTKKKKWLTKP